MSKALYRKYRSKKLSEVVGQKHITTVLENALKQGKIAHAYLFTGPRGVGKTSIARILAHEINDLPYSEEDNHPDIIEIDAASNNGVDDIRQLRDNVQVAPFSAKYRVYIIDEVHMLSKAAFNALLKTLEEPPEHAVFILATTDAHKLPATIISRTQRFVFRFISKEDVCAHLEFIAKNEKINISKEAIEIIAERGEGSFRDSISLLDQISSITKKSEEITANLLEEALGLAPKMQINALISAFENQNSNEILQIVRDVRNSGVDLKNFASQLLSFITENVGKKPYLSQFLTPLTRAEKSNFIEMELLSIFIQPSFAPQLSINQNISPQVQQKTISKPKDKNKKMAEISKSESENQPNSQKETFENSQKNENLEDKTEIPQKDEENKSLKNEIPESLNEIPPKNENKNQDLGDKKEFKWADFWGAIDEGDKGVQTILKQSGHIFENGKIKIYTGRPFNQKQLEKAKAQASMGKALKKIGADGWVIEVFGTAKPASDPAIASVQDLMGGGEMVKIDE